MAEIIKRPRLEPADNGLIVAYEKYEKADDDSKDPYCSEKWCGDGKEVFTFDDSTKALNRFLELCKKAGLIKDKITITE